MGNEEWGMKNEILSYIPHSESPAPNLEVEV